jgi:hypothetical protein
VTRYSKIFLEFKVGAGLALPQLLFLCRRHPQKGVLKSYDDKQAIVKSEISA